MNPPASLAAAQWWILTRSHGEAGGVNKKINEQKVMETNDVMNLPVGLVVVDLETTGLDAERCGVLEIGAVRWDGAVWYCRRALERGRRVEPEALECNGIDAVDLGLGVEGRRAFALFAEWLRGGMEDLPEKRKLVLVGRNAPFDRDFLAGTAAGECFGRTTLDLHGAAMVAAVRGGRGEVVGGKMDAVYGAACELGAEPRPHHALRGALHEWECLRRLCGLSPMPSAAFERFLLEMGHEWRRDKDVVFASEAGWVSQMVALMGAALEGGAE